MLKHWPLYEFVVGGLYWSKHCKYFCIDFMWKENNQNFSRLCLQKLDSNLGPSVTLSTMEFILLVNVVRVSKIRYLLIADFRKFKSQILIRLNRVKIINFNWKLPKLCIRRMTLLWIFNKFNIWLARIRNHLTKW